MPHDPLRTPLGALLDPELLGSAVLIEALTHRSAGTPNNERLEYLGDSVLELVVSEHLYAQLGDADEGALTRVRAALVKKESLAAIARELELGVLIRLGPGERKSGGHRRDSILADALEAVIGACYLEGGLQAARRLIARLYGERWLELPNSEALKDPKTRLQEHLQARGLPPPRYELVDVSGQDHSQRFVVRCEIEARGLGSEGEGSSRRKAEQAAAAVALTEIGA
jgi:ribonuclease-3